MPYSLPKLLELMAPARYCLADWEQKCAEHYAAIRPLLIPSVGELAWSYPTDWPPIRYTIDPRGDRYAGFVTDDNEVTAFEDRWFDVEDLQIWHLDPNKVAAFLGPMNAPHVADKPVARVSGDFAAITLPSGCYMPLALKYKRRAFLRAVAAFCRENKTDIFDAERVIEDYNNALPPTKQKRAISTPRVMSDLFKGQKDEFTELFETRDQTAGIFRLKVRFEGE